MNYRLYIAQSTKAKKVNVVIDKSQEGGKQLAQRTKKNGLPISGTSQKPTLR